MAEGRQTVAGAYAKIEAHESDCTLRYEALGKSIAGLEETVKGFRNGAFALLLGLIGWLAIQYFERRDPPAPPTVVVAPAPAAALPNP